MANGMLECIEARQAQGRPGTLPLLNYVSRVTQCFKKSADHVVCCMWVQTSVDWTCLRERLRKNIQQHLPNIIPPTSPARSIGNAVEDSDSNEETGAVTEVGKPSIQPTLSPLYALTHRCLRVLEVTLLMMLP
jgi:hypothetical protein